MPSTKLSIVANLNLTGHLYDAAVELASAFNNWDVEAMSGILAKHPDLAHQEFFHRSARRTVGPTPLPHLCVDAKWLKGLRVVASYPSAQAVVASPSGKSVLGHAVSRLNLPALRALLKMGMDPCGSGDTLPPLALLPAIDPSGVGVDPVLAPARLLLKAGADPWQMVKYGSGEGMMAVATIPMLWARLSLAEVMLRHAPVPQSPDLDATIADLKNFWFQSMIKCSPEEHMSLADAMIERGLLPPLTELVDRLPNSDETEHWQSGVSERRNLCAVIDYCLDRFPDMGVPSNQLAALCSDPRLSNDPMAPLILARLQERVMEQETGSVLATPPRVRL